jgi:hypothetical protein
MPVESPPTCVPLATLAEIGSRSPPLPTETTTTLLLNLAEELVRLQNSGFIHRALRLTTIRFDPSSHAVVLDSPPELVRFGGVENDPDCTPIALRRAEPIALAASVAAVREALTARGIEFPAESIDVYQFGTLACRIFTGESVEHYLRSAKAKAKVPSTLRPIVECALGNDPVRKFENAAALFQSLQQAIGAPPSPPKPSNDTSLTGSPHRGPADTDATGAGPAPARHAKTTAAAFPWERLGHYEIVDRIGHGGMGDVYKGYERALDRTVAIKVLPTELARDEDFVRRFRAEAAAAARVIHQNVIPIHFIGEDQGCHFFAMHYVEGETLGALLARRGRLPVDETLDLLEQVLAGLDAAHQQGLVHRDIKPGNILLDRVQGRALLADFGLVKSLREGDRMTATGVVMGTVDYISPEQGRGLAVDSRSDLYSLGALAFQMLSGRLPFEGTSPTALIFQHVYDRPQPLREIVPEIPASLAAVVSRLLAKAPDQRHGSAEAVLADLEAVRQKRPLPSGADAALAHDPEAYSRPPVRSRAEVRTLIITAPAFEDDVEIHQWDEVAESTAEPGEAKGWWTRFRLRGVSALRRHAPELLERMQNTEQQMDGAVRECELRRQRLEAMVKEAESVLRELRTQHAACSVSKAPQAQRDAEELARGIAEQTEQLEQMRMQADKAGVAAARLRNQRDLLLARLETARAQGHLAGAKVKRRAIPASPKRKAAQRRRWAVVVQYVLVLGAIGWAAFTIHLKLADMEQERERRTQAPASNVAAARATTEGVAEKQIAISGDGRLMAVATFDHGLAAAERGRISVWDLRTGAENVTYSVPHQSRGLCFSAQGNMLASSGSESSGRGSELMIWDSTSGRVRHTFRGLAYQSDVCLSNDGKTAFCGIGNLAETLGIFHLETGNSEQVRLPRPRDCIKSLAASPRGDFLALGIDGGLTQRGGRQAIDIRSIEQNRLVTSLQTDMAPRALTFSGDGRLLAGTGKGTIIVWKTDDWSEAATLSPAEPYRKIEMSADGTWLAAVLNGKLELWHIPTQARRQLNLQSAVLDAAFHPGSTLAIGFQKSQFGFLNPETGKEQLLPTFP